MKNVILAATAMSMMSAAIAADSSKCKYQDIDIDTFTKMRTLATKWNVISRTLDNWLATTRLVHVSAVTQGDKNYLAIKFEDDVPLGYELTEDELRNWFVVPEGAPLMILMVDGTIVELAAHQDVRGATRSRSVEKFDANKVRYEANSRATIRYSLDSASVEALTEQGATRVRLSAKDKHFEFEVDKKSVNDIQRALQCLKAYAP